MAGYPKSKYNIMQKRDWFWVLGCLLAAWFVDAALKQVALQNFGPLRFYGPFGFVLHRNPGAMLGIASDLPPILRIVTLSTGGTFLLFMYGAIQYLLPHKLMRLRIGMSFLLGGILGNVTDRILWGSVVDFIVIGTRDIPSPAFNFADAIQWIGYGIVVIELTRNGHLLWPSKEDRKSIWINPDYQLKYSLLLVGLGFAFSVIAGVFTYTYLQVMIDTIAPGPSRYLEQKFLTPFIYTFAMLTVAFMVTLFLIGRILSHRTAGPIYAFERFIEDLIEGRSRLFRLRAGDEFKHLQQLGNKLNEYIQRQKSESDPVLPTGKSPLGKTGTEG